MARTDFSNSISFGTQLTRARKKKGLTQVQLAELLKTSQQMVGYYERKTTNPTIKTVQKIADALGIPIASLTLPSKVSPKHKPGPASKLEQLTQRLAALPRSKQKVVIDMLEGFLEKAS